MSSAAAAMNGPGVASLGDLMRETKASDLRSVGDYEFGHVLGEGQFGTVRTAIHLTSNKVVAVKIINKRKLVPETVRMIRREVAIMKMLRHPNIIRLYEVIDTDEFLFLIMEHAAGGEMMDIILAHGRLREAEARRFFAQAAYALAYCHSHHTVHRDVKAENVLLDENMNVKLIDFGFSNIYDPNNVLHTFCGSPSYAAPELVQRHAYTGPEVDCWSLGVLLYVLVVGELPFTGETYLELYQNIIAASYRMPSFLTAACKDLISSMLQPYPQNRATIIEICNHPWVLAGKLPVPPENTLKMKRGLTESDLDPRVLNHMEALGFDRNAVIESVVHNKYDDAAATYFLMAEGNTSSGRGPLSPISSPRSLQPASKGEMSPSPLLKCTDNGGETSPVEEKVSAKEKPKKESSSKKKSKHASTKVKSRSKRKASSDTLEPLDDPAEYDLIPGTPSSIYNDDGNAEPLSPRPGKETPKNLSKLVGVRTLYDDSRKGRTATGTPMKEPTSPRRGRSRDTSPGDANKKLATTSPASSVKTDSTDSLSSMSTSPAFESRDSSTQTESTQTASPGAEGLKEPKQTSRSVRTSRKKKSGNENGSQTVHVVGLDKGDYSTDSQSTPNSPVDVPSPRYKPEPGKKSDSSIEDNEGDGGKESSKRRQTTGKKSNIQQRNSSGEVKSSNDSDTASGETIREPEAAKLKPSKRKGSSLLARRRRRGESLGVGNVPPCVGLASRECICIDDVSPVDTPDEKKDTYLRSSKGSQGCESPLSMSSSSSTFSSEESAGTSVSLLTPQVSSDLGRTPTYTDSRSTVRKNNDSSSTIKTPRSPHNCSREPSPLSEHSPRRQDSPNCYTSSRDGKKQGTSSGKRNKAVVVYHSQNEAVLSPSSSREGTNSVIGTPEVKDMQEGPPIYRQSSFASTQEFRTKKSYGKDSKRERDDKILASSLSKQESSSKPDKKSKQKKTKDSDKERTDKPTASPAEVESDTKEGDKPRTTRFAISAKTVSDLKPNVIMDRIAAGLAKLEPSVTSKRESSSIYRVLCRDRKVVLEIEVCKLLFLRMYGIKFHRISGDSWVYNDLCKEITASIDLSSEQ